MPAKTRAALLAAASDSSVIATERNLRGYLTDLFASAPSLREQAQQADSELEKGALERVMQDCLEELAKTMAAAFAKKAAAEAAAKIAEAAPSRLQSLIEILENKRAINNANFSAIVSGIFSAKSDQLLQVLVATVNQKGLWATFAIALKNSSTGLPLALVRLAIIGHTSAISEEATSQFLNEAASFISEKDFTLGAPATNIAPYIPTIIRGISSIAPESQQQAWRNFMQALGSQLEGLFANIVREIVNADNQPQVWATFAIALKNSAAGLPLAIPMIVRNTRAISDEATRRFLVGAISASAEDPDIWEISRKLLSKRELVASVPEIAKVILTPRALELFLAELVKLDEDIAKHIPAIIRGMIQSEALRGFISASIQERFVPAIANAGNQPEAWRGFVQAFGDHLEGYLENIVRGIVNAGNQPEAWRGFVQALGAPIPPRYIERIAATIIERTTSGTKDQAWQAFIAALGDNPIGHFQTILVASAREAEQAAARVAEATVAVSKVAEAASAAGEQRPAAEKAAATLRQTDALSAATAIGEIIIFTKEVIATEKASKDFWLIVLRTIAPPSIFGQTLSRLTENLLDVVNFPQAVVEYAGADSALWVNFVNNCDPSWFRLNIHAFFVSIGANDGARNAFVDAVVQKYGLDPAILNALVINLGVDYIAQNIPRILAIIGDNANARNTFIAVVVRNLGKNQNIWDALAQILDTDELVDIVKVVRTLSEGSIPFAIRTVVPYILLLDKNYWQQFIQALKPDELIDNMQNILVIIGANDGARNAFVDAVVQIHRERQTVLGALAKGLGAEYIAQNIPRILGIIGDNAEARTAFLASVRPHYGTNQSVLDALVGHLSPENIATFTADQSAEVMTATFDALVRAQKIGQEFWTNLVSRKFAGMVFGKDTSIDRIIQAIKNMTKAAQEIALCNFITVMVQKFGPSRDLWAYFFSAHNKKDILDNLPTIAQAICTIEDRQYDIFVLFISTVPQEYLTAANISSILTKIRSAANSLTMEQFFVAAVMQSYNRDQTVLDALNTALALNYITDNIVKLVTIACNSNTPVCNELLTRASQADDSTFPLIIDAILDGKNCWRNLHNFLLKLSPAQLSSAISKIVSIIYQQRDCWLFFIAAFKNDARWSSMIPMIVTAIDGLQVDDATKQTTRKTFIDALVEEMRPVNAPANPAQESEYAGIIGGISDIPVRAAVLTGIGRDNVAHYLIAADTDGQLVRNVSPLLEAEDYSSSQRTQPQVRLALFQAFSEPKEKQQQRPNSNSFLSLVQTRRGRANIENLDQLLNILRCDVCGKYTFDLLTNYSLMSRLVKGEQELADRFLQILKIMLQNLQTVRSISPPSTATGAAERSLEKALRRFTNFHKKHYPHGMNYMRRIAGQLPQSVDEASIMETIRNGQYESLLAKLTPQPVASAAAPTSTLLGALGEAAPAVGDAPTSPRTDAAATPPPSPSSPPDLRTGHTPAEAAEGNSSNEQGPPPVAPGYGVQ